MYTSKEKWEVVNKILCGAYTNPTTLIVIVTGLEFLDSDIWTVHSKCTRLICHEAVHACI